MRIAIVGSRDYPALDEVRAFVRACEPGTIIVSGGARGVDRVAVEEAQRCGLQTEVYPADWTRDGTRAGFLRNKTIVARADRVVAFWDGTSRGTAHSITLARTLKKPLHIVRPDAEIP